MIATVVYVSVKSENIEEFQKASIKNHLSSIKEPGNIRFDVIQNADDSSKFILYEAYESAENAAAHKDTSHYKEWRETVADMMAEPRNGVKYNIIRPEK